MCAKFYSFLYCHFTEIKEYYFVLSKKYLLVFLLLKTMYRIVKVLNCFENDCIKHNSFIKLAC